MARYKKLIALKEKLVLFFCDAYRKVKDILRNNNRLLQKYLWYGVVCAIFLVAFIWIIYSIYTITRLTREFALFHTDQKVITYNGRTFVRYDESPVAMTLVTDTQCDKCKAFLEKVRTYVDVYVPTAFVVGVRDIAREDDVQWAREHGIVAAPAVVFDDTIVQTNFYKRARQFFMRKGNSATFYPYSMAGIIPRHYKSAPPTDSGISIGSDDASVTIHAFMGLDCALCATQYTVLNALYKKYGARKLRIVYHFARQTAQADALHAGLICAHEQKKAQAYMARIFSRIVAWRAVKDADAVRMTYARLSNLDLNTFDACLADENTLSAYIDTDDHLFNQFGVTAVPVLFIGTQRFDGVQTYNILAKEIDTSLSKSEK